MHVKALLSFSFSFLLTWTRLGVHRAHSAVRKNPVVFLYLFCAPSCPHPSVFFSACSLLGLFFIIIISSSLHAFLHFVPRTHFALILFPLQPFVDSELSFFFFFSHLHLLFLPPCSTCLLHYSPHLQLRSLKILPRKCTAFRYSLEEHVKSHKAVHYGY